MKQQIQISEIENGFIVTVCSFNLNGQPQQKATYCADLDAINVHLASVVTPVSSSIIS